MKELILLGTGNALVTHCYNTCFAIREGEDFFLVDAGGGNQILSRLEEAGLALENLRGMFLTHTHSDHVLGAVWVLRMMDALLKKGGRDFTVWCHDEGAAALSWLCENILANGGKPFGYGGGRIHLQEVRDGDAFSCMGMDFCVFDVHSTKKKQFGFTARFDGKKLVCLGDEPLHPSCAELARDADLLLCEAFCLDRDEARFHAHEKHHSTAREAALTAAELGAKALLLYHAEESDLPRRRENYGREASAVFPGPVYVPDDMETLTI